MCVCVVCFMSSLFLCLAHQTLYSHVLFPLSVLALPLPSRWLLRLSGCICVNENWNNNILQNVSLRRPPPPLAPPPFLCCVCFLSTRFFLWSTRDAMASKTAKLATVRLHVAQADYAVLRMVGALSPFVFVCPQCAAYSHRGQSLVWMIVSFAKLTTLSWRAWCRV